MQLILNWSPLEHIQQLITEKQRTNLALVNTHDGNFLPCRSLYKDNISRHQRCVCRWVPKKEISNSSQHGQYLLSITVSQKELCGDRGLIIHGQKREANVERENRINWVDVLNWSLCRHSKVVIWRISPLTELENNDRWKSSPDPEWCWFISRVWEVMFCTVHVLFCDVKVYLFCRYSQRFISYNIGTCWKLNRFRVFLS